MRCRPGRSPLLTTGRFIRDRVAMASPFSTAHLFRERFGEWTGSPDDETLGTIDAQLSKQLERLDVLESFGGGRHTERPGQTDDGRDDVLA